MSKPSILCWGPAWLALCACTRGPFLVEPDDTAAPADHHTVAVLATTSNTYDVGALTTVTLDGHAATDVAAIHPDAVVHVEGGVVWQINRLLVDTVRAYAPGHWSAPMMEASTGTASNPHDVAVCGDVVVVSRYEHASLLVLDGVDGHEVGAVDLSAAADADALPEASDLVWLGDTLFVGLQRLDRTDAWSTAPGGWLGEVDCEGRTLGRTFPVGPNPVVVSAPRSLVIASEDGVRTFDGAEVGEPLFADVDGFVVVDLAFGDDGRGAFVARQGAEHMVGCIDVDTWTPVVAGILDAYVADVAVNDRGEAWLAVWQSWSDPSNTGGVGLLDLDDCTLADDLVPTRFPPFSIDFY